MQPQHAHTRVIGRNVRKTKAGAPENSPRRSDCVSESNQRGGCWTNDCCCSFLAAAAVTFAAAVANAAFPHLHTHTHTHTHTHKPTGMYRRVNPNTHTHTHTQTHKPTGMYRRVKPNTHTHTHTHTHAQFETEADGRLPPRQHHIIMIVMIIFIININYVLQNFLCIIVFFIWNVSFFYIFLK